MICSWKPAQSLNSDMVSMWKERLENKVASHRTVLAHLVKGVSSGKFSVTRLTTTAVLTTTEVRTVSAAKKDWNRTWWAKTMVTPFPETLCCGSKEGKRNLEELSLILSITMEGLYWLGEAKSFALGQVWEWQHRNQSRAISGAFTEEYASPKGRDHFVLQT